MSAFTCAHAFYLIAHRLSGTLPTQGYPHATVCIAIAILCFGVLSKLHCLDYADCFYSEVEHCSRSSKTQKNESCYFFMWCDDFMAAGTSCKSRCQCNEDEVMQKLVEENEKLRKRVHQLELQLEKKTQIAASLGRVISTLTTEENDG
ncbi:hypothetical protein Taro_009108 [Colocasia esculenta]|uniref:Uncharacterized protein n=1 Tax=Colocasia esculenta TaxID=4460 RepID=A0A843TZ87_COLES|nr:hypothetical protein [Colocasia esculenta]